MKIRLGVTTKVAIAAGLALECIQAQVEIAPERPKWGETLRAVYDSSSKAAQLRAEDRVWAAVTVYFEDYSVQRVAGEMAKAPEGRLEYEMKVPEGACLMEVAFVTAYDYDAKATKKVVISRTDGRPARGADDHLMADHMADAETYFRQEISGYPDNFVAYRNRWFLADGGKDKQIAMVRDDLRQIGEAAGRAGVEWLYAMAYAHWRLGELEKARSAVQQLVREFPESALTQDALSYYIFRASGAAKLEAATVGAGIGGGASGESLCRVCDRHASDAAGFSVGDRAESGAGTIAETAREPGALPGGGECKPGSPSRICTGAGGASDCARTVAGGKIPDRA
jgi:hypothetical protein